MARYGWWENTITTHTDVRAAWTSALTRTVDVDEDTGAPGALAFLRMAGRERSMLACSASMAQLPMRTNPRGWELVARPSLESRRTAGHLREVFDTGEEILPGRVSQMMVHVYGPWSFGAEVEFAGHPLIADRPAFRDCAVSLGEGVRELCDKLSTALSVDVTVVLHEPRITAVLGGLRGATDFERIAPVDREHVHGVWERFIHQVDRPVIIDCEGEWPAELPVGSSDRIVVPFSHVETKAGKDHLGSLLSDGVRVGLAGVGKPEVLARRVLNMWKQWTLDGDLLLDHVDLVVPEGVRTPAEASMDAARVRQAVSLLWQD